MNQRPLDLRRVLTALRRHARLTLAMVVVTAALAAGWALHRPSQPVATAVVLLAPAPVASDGSSTRDMKTEIRIATDQEILQQVSSQLHLGATYNDMQAHVQGSAPTDQLLEIQAHWGSSATAERIANAVADRFVAYTNDNAGDTSDALVTSLNNQIDDYSRQLQTLTTNIKATSTRLAHEPSGSAAAITDSGTLAQLRAAQGQAELQRTDAKTQLALAKSDQANPGAARVLQPSTSTSRFPRVLQIVLYALVGALLGLLLALGVLLTGRAGRRLWRGGDISDAVGAPVVSLLTGHRVRSAAAARRLLRSGRLVDAELWRARRAAHVLGWSDTSRQARPIQLIVFGDDRAAVGAALALVWTMKRQLGSAPPVVTGVDTRAIRAVREAIAAAATDEPATGPSMTLTSVARDRMPVTAVDSDTRTALVVSAGYADPDDLGRLAMAVLDSGSRITAVLLVDPVADDVAVGDQPMPVTRYDGSPGAMA